MGYNKPTLKSEDKFKMGLILNKYHVADGIGIEQADELAYEIFSMAEELARNEVRAMLLILLWDNKDKDIPAEYIKTLVDILGDVNVT